MNFIISHLEGLKAEGCLEEKLIPAYVYAENFKDILVFTLNLLRASKYAFVGSRHQREMNSIN